MADPIQHAREQAVTAVVQDGLNAHERDQTLRVLDEELEHWLDGRTWQLRRRAMQDGFWRWLRDILPRQRPRA